MTTSSFSQGAREYAGSIENKIVLIDGEELAGLMIDYGVGVSTTNLYEIKRIDFDYFVERVQSISFSSQVFVQCLIFESIASRKNNESRASVDHTDQERRRTESGVQESGRRCFFPGNPPGGRAGLRHAQHDEVRPSLWRG
ncbi:MAG: restriction endonuclease [Desulfohalobiaceae bacterium]|nr:restriction endonuclease [Desulfohalobiaceae bacterium]